MGFEQASSASWSRAARSPLLWILVLAFVTRLPALWFGLPYLIVEKDEQRVVGTAVVMFTGDWNPHEFRYASLFFYLVRASFAPLEAWWNLRGESTEAVDLIARFVVSPTTFYVAARILSLAAGVAIVAFTAFVARRIAGETASWVAALFAALAPLHFELSTVARVDAAMTFGIVAALWFAVRYDDDRRARDALLAAVCTGVAVSIKYTAVLMMPIVVGIAWLDPKAPAPRLLRRRLARMAILCAIPAAVVLISSPYAILDFESFLKDTEFNTELIATPFSASVKPGYELYPGLLAGWTYGLGLLAASLVGAFALLRSRPRAAWPLVSFGVIYAIVTFVSKTAYDRFLLPLIAVLVVLAAIGVVDTARALRRPAWVVALVALAPTLPQAAGQVVVEVVGRETRLIALRLIERSIPSGSLLVTGIERLAPPVAEENAPMLSDIVWLRAHLLEKGKIYRDVAERSRALQSAVGRPAYRVIRARGVEWIQAARTSKPAAIVLSDAETTTLPEDLRLVYEDAVTFAPGLFRDGPRVDVFLRRR